MSIDTINQIFQGTFTLFNVWPPGSCNIVKQTVEKAKWIALYTEPISIYREKGKDLYPTDSDMERIRIANENGYREPTVLEYGVSFHAHSFYTGKSCSTWLSSAKKQMAQTIDEHIEVNGVEIKFYIDSDGQRTSTQCSSPDIDWEGTFGYMVCKEL